MLTITQTSCGVFDITRTTANTANIEIYTIDDTKTLVLSETQSLVSGLTINKTLADGVYTVKDTFDNLSYKIIVFCGFESCVLEKINELVCGSVDCGCGCSESKNEYTRYDLNAIILMYFAFLSLLNDIYVAGWQFSSLSTTELDDLYVLSKIIEQTDNYCNCND